MIKKGLKILISLSLLVWLIGRLDFNQLKDTLQGGRYVYLFFFVLFFFTAAVLIRALKLFILIKDEQTNYRTTVQIVLKSLFINNILPTSIGGDAYKVYYLKKHKSASWSESFILIVLERLSGLIVLSLAGIIYIILNFSKLTEYLLLREVKINLNIKLAGLILVLILTAVYFILMKKRGKIVDFCIRCKQALQKLPASTYLFLFLFSVMFHLVNITGFCFLAKFFNESILWFDMIFVLFVTTMISLLPISLGALGVREASLTICLSLFGVSGTNAIGFALTNRFILIIVSLFGWILYITEKKKSKS